jgi:hypothetical protein
MTRLGNYYMPSYGNGDSMTEPFWFNGGMGTRFGSEYFRETWYIPAENQAGTGPFFRLLGGADHMDSDNPNEASSLGYTMEFLLGYPWTSQKPGTLPLTRYRNNSVFEHATWMNTAPPPGYSLSVRWNGISAPARYGFERFGNLLTWCEVEEVAYDSFHTIANSKIRIQLHKIWGNGIGRITWLPTNTQLVRENIGAMVQSTLFHKVTLPSGSTPPPPPEKVIQTNPDGSKVICCDYNPTQSGGIDRINGGNTRRWAGSPVVSYTKTATRTISEVKPFNFSFDEWTGSDPFSPLLWKGTFRSIVELNALQIGGIPYEDVIRLRFDAKVDSTTVDTDFQNMNNTFWLSMSTLGNGYTGFRYESVNVDTGAVTTRTNPTTFVAAGGASNGEIPPMSEGVVFSRNDNSFAMGFYTPGVFDPCRRVRSYEYFWWCDGGLETNCEPKHQTLVLNAFRETKLSTSYEGATHFIPPSPNCLLELTSTTPAPPLDTYMILGTRTDVIRRLKQLKCSLDGRGEVCKSIS